MNTPPGPGKPSSAYHHGDLRNALLAAARRALDAGAYEKLSLRELARLAGVSAYAPYRHFASKDEVLAEVAAQGFRELTERMDAEAHPEPRERLARLADVYTSFACDHPALYRVMFGIEKQALIEFPVMKEAAGESFGRLVVATIAAHGSGHPEEAATLARASGVWALVHGWARLVIDGLTYYLPKGSITPASTAARAIIASWSRNEA